MNIFAWFIALLTDFMQAGQGSIHSYYRKSRNVIKEIVIVHCATFELWMHLGGLLRSQEARVALSYRFVRLLRFFRA